MTPLTAAFVAAGVPEVFAPGVAAMLERSKALFTAQPDRDAPRAWRMCIPIMLEPFGVPIDFEGLFDALERLGFMTAAVRERIRQSFVNAS